MYCVYFFSMEAEANFFETLGEALKHAEDMRVQGYRFVTLVSENPNSVGKPGVADPSPDYNWTKRRTTELRFPKT